MGPWVLFLQDPSNFAVRVFKRQMDEGMAVHLILTSNLLHKYVSRCLQLAVESSKKTFMDAWGRWNDSMCAYTSASDSYKMLPDRQLFSLPCAILSLGVQQDRQSSLCCIHTLQSKALPSVRCCTGRTPLVQGVCLIWGCQVF